MTASSAKEKAPLVFVLLLAFFSVLVSSLNIFAFKNRKVEYIAIDKTYSQIERLEKIINQYPTYRDAYIELAKLYENEGDLDMAMKLVQMAHRIDPLNDEVIEYGTVLGVRSF